MVDKMSFFDIILCYLFLVKRKIKTSTVFAALPKMISLAFAYRKYR
jgi:hypothetical protein